MDKVEIDLKLNSIYSKLILLGCIEDIHELGEDALLGFQEVLSHIADEVQSLNKSICER